MWGQVELAVIDAAISLLINEGVAGLAVGILVGEDGVAVEWAALNVRWVTVGDAFGLDCCGELFGRNAGLGFIDGVGVGIVGAAVFGVNLLDLEAGQMGPDLVEDGCGLAADTGSFLPAIKLGEANGGVEVGHRVEVAQEA